ncbi:MAG: rod shape-determining protein MreC [bacterium]|nr:rod shape-determining protein MreC [bacterium]
MAKRVKIIIVAAVIGLAVFFNSFLETPKNFIYGIFLPFQKASSVLSRGTADFFEIFFRLKDLKVQNKRLMEENQHLLSEIAGLNLLELENNFLRKEVGLKSEPKFEFILADVIGLDIQNAFQSLFIDKGEQDGVRIGQTVILAGRILLGRVAEVYKKTSKIETVFNFQSRVNVITQNSRVSGVIAANYPGILMDLIDPRKTIIPGERILTSGSAGIFPKGLLVGEISEVIRRDNQIFQQAKISVPYDIRGLESVLIIANY